MTLWCTTLSKASSFMIMLLNLSIYVLRLICIIVVGKYYLFSARGPLCVQDGPCILLPAILTSKPHANSQTAPADLAHPMRVPYSPG